LDIDNTTCEDNVEALLNKLRYLKAKDKVTGSSTSNTVCSSFFSDSFALIVIVPPPISPFTANLIASFDVSIETVSDIYAISLQILVNSEELIVQIELYSVSGIPNCSLSSVIKFNENSEILSFLLLSNKKVIFDGSSSAFIVIISSFPAHFIILARFVILKPNVYGLSARYVWKPASLRSNDTKATWDESMA